MIVDKIFEILNISTIVIIDLCHVTLNQIYEVYYNKPYNFGKVCSGSL